MDQWIGCFPVLSGLGRLNLLNGLRCVRALNGSGRGSGRWVEWTNGLVVSQCCLGWDVSIS